MPGKPVFYSTHTVVASLTTSAETVIATLPNVSGDNDQDTVKLTGWANITTDGAATAIVLRVRRGTLTGTQVTPSASQGQTAAFAAGFIGNPRTEVVDNPGAVAAQTYVLTAQATANGGTCTVNAVHLEARVD